MPVSETLESVGCKIAEMDFPPRIINHEASTPLGQTLAEVAAKLEESSQGALQVSAGDGADLPGVPALSIVHPHRGKIHYMAAPEGPEEAPFINALTAMDSVNYAYRDKLEKMEMAAEIIVFIAASCPHCPKAVSAANAVALMSPAVTTIIVDAQHNEELAAKFGVKSVPCTLLDRGLSIVGEITVAELVERILNRGTDEQGAKVLFSLIEQDRLDEAVEFIREKEGTQLFVAAWRKSSLASRIGFMILVEAILQEDEHALDDSVPNLIAILDSGDASLRGDTADVLGQIGHPSAIPALKNLQNDENPDVADIASEALGEIEDRME